MLRWLTILWRKLTKPKETSPQTSNCLNYTSPHICGHLLFFSSPVTRHEYSWSYLKPTCALHPFLYPGKMVCCCFISSTLSLASFIVHALLNHFNSMTCYYVLLQNTLPLGMSLSFISYFFSTEPSQLSILSVFG